MIRRRDAGGGSYDSEMAQKSGLPGIVKLLLVLIVGFFAITQGWPWLRDRLGGGSESVPAGNEEAGRCVARAEAASQALADAIIRFQQPPADLEAWDSARSGAEDRISSAEEACACPAESCKRAETALSEIRDLAASADDMLRGGSGFSNLATRQERIDELINGARNLARQGR